VPQKLKVIMFSGKNATEIKAQIENDTELLQEIMNPSTYFFYTLFQDETNQNINAALSIVVIIVLVFVMTSLGNYLVFMATSLLDAGVVLLSSRLYFP